MDSPRTAAVLEAARQLFEEQESNGHVAAVGNGPQVIGEKLGFPPAEVLVILRNLHRKGRIGLSNGIGPNATIARAQEALRPVTTVITGGGTGAKIGKARRARPSEGDEPPESTEDSELLDRIAQLEKALDEAQAATKQAEERRSNMRDARQRSDEAKARVEEELRRVKAENRTLSQRVETLQVEAAKVADLERQISQLERPQVLPDELAATIARLTRE